MIDCLLQGFSVSGAGCVPLVNAVCCDNGYNACPAGTTCNLVNGHVTPAAVM